MGRKPKIAFNSDIYYKIVELMKLKWPMARIQDWLRTQGIEISIGNLFRFRNRHVPPEEIIPIQYEMEKLLKNIDIRLDQLSESAKLILVQKERLSKALEHEKSLGGILLPGMKSEIRTLHDMIMASYDREHGLSSGKQVIQQTQINIMQQKFEQALEVVMDERDKLKVPISG